MQKTMVKCPGCDYALPEDALVEQIDHMEANHMDIVKERVRRVMRQEAWENE